MRINLILLRHGPAGDPIKFQIKKRKPDDERPLTKYGQKVVKRVSRYLKRNFFEVHNIYYSPLVRTAQTAQIVHEKFPTAKLKKLDALKPQFNREKILEVLAQQENNSTGLLVGHSPKLGEFLSFILTGSEQVFFDIEKGGFAWVELHFDQKHQPKALLKCYMSPSQVRKVKRKSSKRENFSSKISI